LNYINTHENELTSNPFKQKYKAVAFRNRTELPQNGLQKYTIPIENNACGKKKVFLI